MPDPLLLIENMIQRQEGGFSLKAPRMAIYPGRSYAVTGPNGAGKTTLLKTLALLRRPADGAMTFDGAPVMSDERLEQQSRRQITLVMQDAYLFRTSVFNNVAYGLRVRGEVEYLVRTKVSRALDAVRLPDFGPRKASQLSRGETQRVAIARALALEPRLLLLDEPTANVDRDNVGIIEEIITHTMASQGIAVVFSTHQLDQAYRLADEIVSLRDGVILATSPANLFTGEIVCEADHVFVRLSDRVVIHVSTTRKGRVHVRIPPEDIIISNAKLESSARNSFPGTITGAFVEGEQIRLDLDIGVVLSSIITRQSFTGMGLTAGDRVYVTFKTSAVQVY